MRWLVFHYYQRHFNFRSGQAFISFTWNLFSNTLLLLIRSAYVGTCPGEFNYDDQHWQWFALVWLIHDAYLVVSVRSWHGKCGGKWAVWNETSHRAPLESTALNGSPWPPQVVSVRTHWNKDAEGIMPPEASESLVLTAHQWSLSHINDFCQLLLPGLFPELEKIILDFSW